MHIKHIHCMIESLASGLKSDVNENMKPAEVKIIGEAVDMLKDLCEAEYYARAAKCLEADMEDAEHDKMYYRGQPRRANGEYMSRRGRRAYTTPYYHMPPEFDYDMIGLGMGMDSAPDKMYYTGQVGGKMGSRTDSNYTAGTMTGPGSNRSMSYYGDGRSTKYGYSHDEYMAKMRDESPEGKKKRQDAFRERVNDLADMLAEEMEEMTKEEQQMWRNKLNKLINN